MEEFKNGIISEEALDEIAGGLNINKAKIKSVFKTAGIGISAVASVLAAISATSLVAKEGYDCYKKGRKGKVEEHKLEGEEHKEESNDPTNQ